MSNCSAHLQDTVLSKMIGTVAQFFCNFPPVLHYNGFDLPDVIDYRCGGVQRQNYKTQVPVPILCSCCCRNNIHSFSTVVQYKEEYVSNYHTFMFVNYKFFKPQETWPLVKGPRSGAGPRPDCTPFIHLTLRLSKNSVNIFIQPDKHSVVIPTNQTTIITNLLLTIYLFSSKSPDH